MTIWIGLKMFLVKLQTQKTNFISPLFFFIEIVYLVNMFWDYSSHCALNNAKSTTVYNLGRTLNDKLWMVTVPCHNGKKVTRRVNFVLNTLEDIHLV